MLAGEAQVKLKDYAGARDTYREVKRINPGEPLIEYDLALMDYFLGKHDDSLRRVESARKLYPRHEPTRSLHYDLWIGKTMEFVRAEDYEEAKKAVRTAGMIKKEDPRAPFLLGNIHVLEHLYEPAMYRYRRALALDPNFRPAAENLKKIEELVRRPGPLN
jgi:tetratricopeptide (TPR) repeat protein